MTQLSEKIAGLTGRIKTSASPGAVIGVVIMLIAVVLASLWNLSNPQETQVELKNSDLINATEEIEPTANLNPPKTQKEGSLTSSDNLTIYISGEVNKPGLYTLKTPARLADAVTAAQGLTAAADPDVINLAAHLHDADHIHIPAKTDSTGHQLPYQISNGSSPGTGTTNPASPGRSCINLATADLTQLTTLPGIGEKTAQTILNFRDTNGLHKPDDLLNVKGIGQKTLQKLTPHLCP